MIASCHLWYQSCTLQKIRISKGSLGNKLEHGFRKPACTRRLGAFTVCHHAQDGCKGQEGYTSDCVHIDYTECCAFTCGSATCESCRQERLLTGRCGKDGSRKSLWLRFLTRGKRQRAAEFAVYSQRLVVCFRTPGGVLSLPDRFALEL
mmetsp:Transcript_63219/g.165768  ORF Transcript_63219/g.165768 Transcript_63219/m.165768 type:complete len:149 (-) Transcript_63219:1075-1521(-)